MSCGNNIVENINFVTGSYFCLNCSEFVDRSKLKMYLSKNKLVNLFNCVKICFLLMKKK